MAAHVVVVRDRRALVTGEPLVTPSTTSQPAPRRSPGPFCERYPAHVGILRTGGCRRTPHATPAASTSPPANPWSARSSTATSRTTFGSCQPVLLTRAPARL